MDRVLQPCCVSGWCILLLAGPGVAQTYFTGVTEQAFAPIPYRFGPRALAFGDYNNDGWPDLFLAEDRDTRMGLWQNQGNGRFMDESAVLPADPSVSILGGGSVFGDYDNDGDLDLYVPVGAYVENLILSQKPPAEGTEDHSFFISWSSARVEVSLPL
jgi:hypothetical protein